MSTTPEKQIIADSIRELERAARWCDVLRDTIGAKTCSPDAVHTILHIAKGRYEKVADRLREVQE